MAHDDDGTRSGPKPLTGAAALAAAFLARRSLAFAWRKATGKEPPADPGHPSVGWPEALTWAAVSGAVMGLARLGAQKKVVDAWSRSVGRGRAQDAEAGADRDGPADTHPR